MMASSSALDFQYGSRIEPKPEGRLSPPEKTHDPKARSRSPRRGVLQDCGAVALQGRDTPEGSYFSRDY